MPIPSEPDSRKFTGMRKAGETDMSSETIWARNAVVVGVNEFIEEIAELQKAMVPLKIGNFSFPIEAEPKVRHTNLGRTAIGLRAIGIEKNLGASLYGDGATSPRTFELVTIDETGSSMTFRLSGTNPMLIKREDGSVDYRASDRTQGLYNATAASLTIEKTIHTDDEVLESSETYSIGPDGVIHKILHGASALQPTNPSDFLSFDETQRVNAKTIGMEVQALREIISIAK